MVRACAPARRRMRNGGWNKASHTRLLNKMTDHLRQAIITEIAKGLALLRAPPEAIATAETSHDPHQISAIFDSCNAPIGYLAAIGSYRDATPDEETLEQLIEMNRIVGEIVAGAQTRQDVLDKLRADERLSFRRTTTHSEV
jgi:hypothetical protein